MKPLSEIIFKSPEHIECQSAWYEHIPFAFFLVESVKPNLFVELGTHYGLSYFAFCQAIKYLDFGGRAFSVDTWVGDEFAGFYSVDVFEEVSRINNLHYSHFSELLKMTFDEASGSFDDGSVDLLHIDGKHGYKDVYHDFYTWLPKMSNKGVVILHDTQEVAPGFGVKLFMTELSDKFPSMEFYHGHGLGIICTGSEVNPDFLQFIENYKKSSFIQSLFANLGNKITLTRQNQVLATELRNIQELLKVSENNLVQVQTLWQEQGNELVQANAILREKDNELVQVKTILQEQENLLARVKTILQEKETELLLEKAISQKKSDEIILEYGTIVTQKATEINNLECEITTLSNKLEDKNLIIARLTNSISWKITKPLRFLKRSNIVTHFHFLRVARTLRSSGLFDKAYYLQDNTDVRESGMNPVKHYLLYGGLEGRNPCPGFNGKFYLENYPDVSEAKLNPLLHYIVYGRKEGRIIQPGSKNEDLPVVIDPVPVADEIVEPTPESTVTETSADDLQIMSESGLFDRDFYLRSNLDVEVAGVDPFLHFSTFGWKENRNPSPTFDTNFYLTEYEDVKNAGTNPLLHYIKFGREEGRLKHEFGKINEQLRIRSLQVVVVSTETHTPGHNYRVINYVDACNDLGISAAWFTPDWLAENLRLLDHAKILVFWRTVYVLSFQTIVDYAKQNKLLIVYDMDDLMFDPELAEPEVIDSIRSLHPNKEFLKIYCARIATAIYHADICTCTTHDLAKSLNKFGKKVYVLPNGYSRNVLELSEQLLLEQGKEEEVIRIGYAGGTLTHQKDFGVAVPAIASVLKEFPKTVLTVFEGVCNLGEFPELDEFRERIEFRKMVPHAEFQKEINRFDINLAPLQINAFCNAKSELKFFEAALLRIPTIASPTPPFKDIITNGINGYLAVTADDWYDYLKLLILDKDQRNKVGKNACTYTLWHFGPEQRMQVLHSFLTKLPGGDDLQFNHGKLRTQALLSPKNAACTENSGTYSYPVIAGYSLLAEYRGKNISKAGVLVILNSSSKDMINTLDSVKSQSIKDIDLAIIGDPSTLNSMETVIRWLEINHPEFNQCVVLQTNRDTGLGKKLNTGFDCLQTPFVVPITADSILFPNFLEQCLAVMDRSGAAVVYPKVQLPGFENSDKDPDFTTTLLGDDLWNPERLSAGNYISFPALMSKACWSKAGGFSTGLQPDFRIEYDYWLRCIDNGLFGINIPYILARCHNQQPVNPVNTCSSIKQSPTILFIGHDDYLAGAQVLLLSLMRWFKRNTEFELKLILLQDKDGLLNEYRETASVIFWEKVMEEFPDPIKRNVAMFEFSGKVDMIYGNTVLAATIYSELEFLNVPYVTHIHELENVIRVLLDTGSIEKMKSLSRRFIACSNPVASNLIVNHAVDQKKITTISEFIELKKPGLTHSKSEWRLKLGLDPDLFIILGCGTMSHRKGVDLFIDTVLALRQRGFSKFHFYWIGENTWDIDFVSLGFSTWSGQEQKILTAGATDYVTFLGVKNNLFEYILAADLFYLPSREDPFPLVCLEAAYGGIPTICFKDAGGIPDFVENDAGFVVPFKDIGEAADKIQMLAKNRPLLNELGSNAQAKIISRHSVDIAAPEILKICRQAINPEPEIAVPIIDSDNLKTGKKIVFVTTNDGSSYGGSEKLWRHAATECRKRGNDVMIVIKKWNPEPNFISDFYSLGIKTVFKNYDHFGQVIRFNPDLAILSIGDQDEGIDWYDFCRQNDLPYVIVNHLTKEPVYWPVKTEITEQLKKGYLGAETVLFTGKNNLEIMERRLSCKIPRAGIFFNPVDIDRSIAIPFPPFTRGLKIAIVANLLKIHKGQHLAIDLFNLSKWRERSITLHIYGWGSDEAVLKKQVTDNNQHNVTFHGHTDDILAVWRENHAIFLPSFMEGLPLVLVAAMICGRVPIATDIGAHREIIDDNDTGFIAKGPTVEALDEALERAYQRARDWEEIGQKARQKILTHLPPDPIDHFINQIMSSIKPDRTSHHTLLS